MEYHFTFWFPCKWVGEVVVRFDLFPGATAARQPRVRRSDGRKLADFELCLLGLCHPPAPIYLILGLDNNAGWPTSGLWNQGVYPHFCDTDGNLPLV